MVDHHVDRPGVEAPQGVELTGTNRSDILTNIYAHQNAFMYAALEVLLCTAFPARSAGAPARHRDGDQVWPQIDYVDLGTQQVSGAHGGGVPPVPIPNTAVKPASANDSRAAGPLESRSVPDYLQKSPL